MVPSTTHKTILSMVVMDTDFLFGGGMGEQSKRERERKRKTVQVSMVVQVVTSNQYHKIYSSAKNIECIRCVLAEFICVCVFSFIRILLGLKFASESNKSNY